MDFWKKWEEVINDYAYDLDRYEHYLDLRKAVENDSRVFPNGFNPDNDKDTELVCDLVPEIMSRGEGYACDYCDKIVPLDDIYAVEYGDPDNPNDVKIAKYIKRHHLEDSAYDICQECYKKFLEEE